MAGETLPSETGNVVCPKCGEKHWGYGCPRDFKPGTKAIPTSNDVVERISEHSDADACQRTLDLLNDAAADIKRLQEVIARCYMRLQCADVPREPWHWEVCTTLNNTGIPAKPSEQCPYCLHPVRIDGSILHAGGCAGLDTIKVTRLQYDTLTKAHGNETSERRETGWLVEDGGHTPRYRTMHDGVPVWTDNPNEALRFARRVDAELFSREDEDAWRIVEHQWITLDGDQMHALKASEHLYVPVSSGNDRCSVCGQPKGQCSALSENEVQK